MHLACIWVKSKLHLAKRNVKSIFLVDKEIEVDEHI